MIIRSTVRLFALLFSTKLAIVSAASLGADAAQPTRFYVAPNGNDAWSGALAAPNATGSDGPFATFERARDAVRSLKKAGHKAPVEVVIRGGSYELEQTFVLTPEDSGTESSPIAWRAQDGERVVIRGTRAVTGWKPWRDGIWQADLKAQGLAGVSFHSLYYVAAGARREFSERQVLARHPNFDPAHPRTGGNVYVATNAAKPRENLIYEAGALPFDKWSDIAQAEVVSTYNRGWQFAITPILKHDAQTRTLTVRPVRGEFLKLNRFFIQNVLDALDAPGEWFLDRQHSVLYFKPPDGDPSKGQVLAPVLDHLIEIKGTIPYPYGYLNTAFKGKREEFVMPADAPPLNPVDHVTFAGLDFECARQDAIRLTGARRCAVVRCRVTNAGNIGINLGGVTTSFAEEGEPRVTPATGHPAGAGGGGQILLFNDPCVECRVVGCDVWSIGCEGVMLFGAANVAENNHVHDIGLYAKDAPCIGLHGEKNVARRNTLHDCPRCAVFLKGVDNIVELNDVHHAVLETCDMGAIRMVQRNANLKGNIIRHNLVLDTPGYGFRWQEGTHYESPFYTWSIYLDDYTCGTSIVGNICARSSRGGVMIHGGGDNLVANNILVNAGDYQIEFAPMDPDYPTAPNVYAGNRVERNVIVSTEEGATPYRFMNKPKANPAMANNLIWAGGRELLVLMPQMIGVQGFDKWLALGMEKDSVVADPLFVDTAKDDYRLRPESPAWKLGFEKIPVEQIGCYQSEDRVTWPLPEHRNIAREKPVLHTAPGYKPGTAAAAPGVHFLGPVHEDFEKDTAGSKPRIGDIAAPAPSQIVVTDELAAGGKQCLKIVDAPGLASDWQPRIFYATRFEQGVVRVALDIRLDGKQPPRIYIDPRQYGEQNNTGYVSGPMLYIEPNGDLLGGKTKLTTLPLDKWVHLELRMQLGKPAAVGAKPGASDLIVTVEGQPPRQFKAPNLSAQFQRLDRVVISSLSTAKTVFYIDNVAIEAAEE